MSIDTFSKILMDFASRINLMGLQIDPSGYCCLDVGEGTLVHIKHEPKRDSMIFIAEIGQIPDMNNAQIMRYLLRMNDDPSETKGMTLSYNSENNNAALGYQYPLRFLTIDKFEEFFKMFLDEIDRWKQKMELYTQGTLPSGEEGTAETDSGNATNGSNEPAFMIGA